MTPSPPLSLVSVADRGLHASVSGGLAAVDVQGLAGDERGSLEVEDRVDDVADLAHPAQRVQGRQALVGRRVVSGVLITPRETAFTRTPCEAYSIASERVTATSPPLVREASADGPRAVRVVDQAGVTLTTWPLPWSTICSIARWVMWKNPVRFTAVIVA